MIITVSGSNQFAVQEKVAEIKSDFIDKNGSAGVENYIGEKLELHDLTHILSGVSLFAPKRLAIIKHLSENKQVAEAFIEKLGNVPEELTVLLKENQLDKRTGYYKALKKLSDFYEFHELSEPELVAWIRQRVDTEGGTVDARSARLLYEHVGPDQLRLSNEIEKLIAYDKQITTETIQALVEENPRDTVFQLLDAVLASNRARALSILDGLEKAFEDPFQTANMLIWQTQVLAIVKSAGERSEGDIARQAKLNPYVVKKTKSLAKKVDRAKLASIIEAVASLDIRLKSTSADPWRAVEQTILRI